MREQRGRVFGGRCKPQSSAVGLMRGRAASYCDWIFTVRGLDFVKSREHLRDKVVEHVAKIHVHASNYSVSIIVTY